jgi:hypothetical protein
VFSFCLLLLCCFPDKVPEMRSPRWFFVLEGDLLPLATFCSPQTSMLHSGLMLLVGIVQCIGIFLVPFLLLLLVCRREKTALGQKTVSMEREVALALVLIQECSAHLAWLAVSNRFVLFCFVLFCFVLFCFVLFCFVLFCFVLFFNGWLLTS